MADVIKQVGLIPMSCKPFHAGHDMLIRLAASECDRVELFVSLTDRGSVTGEMMQQIWIEHVFSRLPSNVTVSFSRVTPVRDIYECLGEADKSVPLRPLSFNIYSDAEDVYRNFPDKSLDKYLPHLMKHHRLFRRGIERHETINVSGETVREHIKHGRYDSFVAAMPEWMDHEAVWLILKG